MRNKHHFTGKEDKSELSSNLDMKFKIIKELEFYLNAESVILDFGCGSGKSVQELRENGYNAFGCDIKYKIDPAVDQEYLEKNGLIRKIELKPYKLPFKDSTFDFIYSDDVFEHVKNYGETIAEISRVLKPGGICLHTFASRLRPVESHVLIPFSSINQSYWYLYFWALLGVGDKRENLVTVKDRAEFYYNYLNENTNYLSKKSLRKYFAMYFNEVTFCEKHFLKVSQKGKHLIWTFKIIPFLPAVYSTFRLRVIMHRKPQKNYSIY